MLIFHPFRKGVFIIRNILFFTILTFAIALAGCTSVQTPTAKITNVSVAKQTSEGARVDITVKVKNPNDFTLPTTGANYQVEVSGLKTFKFKTVPSKSLPAKGSQTFMFPAAFATAKSVNNLSYKVSGNIAVMPPGKLWDIAIESGLPHPKANFSKKGILIVTQPTPQSKPIQVQPNF